MNTNDNSLQSVFLLCCRRDVDFDAFIATLSAESGEFAALWTQHRLAPSPSWEKRIQHPARGPRRLFDTTP